MNSSLPKPLEAKVDENNLLIRFLGYFQMMNAFPDKRLERNFANIIGSEGILETNRPPLRVEAKQNLALYR